MARDQKQIHLSAPDCSGRGVRYRTLGPSEMDAVLLVGAKVAGASAGPLEIRVAANREGIKRMLVAVTTQGELTDLSEAKWSTLDAGALELPGPLSYDELVTGKDDGVLSAIYRRLHEPSALEIEAIAGKALPVSAA